MLMTLTTVLPSLRRSIPDPIERRAWPEHTVAAPSRGAVRRRTGTARCDTLAHHARGVPRRIGGIRRGLDGPMRQVDLTGIRIRLFRSTGTNRRRKQALERNRREFDPGISTN
ncbi:hypothetical protein E1I21_10270 [Microbacterium oleivorans]|nr:hypothetical protein E1I21_10270 [Microbacterium oleivorans]